MCKSCASDIDSGICKLIPCIVKKPTLRKLVEHTNEESSRQNALAKIKTFMPTGLPDSHPQNNSGGM